MNSEQLKIFYCKLNNLNTALDNIQTQLSDICLDLITLVHAINHDSTIKDIFSKIDNKSFLDELEKKLNTPE